MILARDFETLIYQIIVLNSMLTDNIEKIGLGPIKKILKRIGGWPVLETDKWNESRFTWSDSMHKLIVPNKRMDYLFQFLVSPNISDPKQNILYVSYSALIQLFNIYNITIKYLLSLYAEF